MAGVCQVFAAWDGKEMVKPARDTKNDKVCIIDTEAKLAWYAKTGNTTSGPRISSASANGILWKRLPAWSGTRSFRL